MARLKYPGGSRTLSSFKGKQRTLASKFKRKKKKKAESLPKNNCKVITPDQYREIFGDSEEEVCVWKCRQTKLQFFIIMIFL